MRKYKKEAIGILILCSCFFFSGCKKKEKMEGSDSYQLFYVNKEETKVVAQQYEAGSKTVEELVIEFLGALDTDSENVDLKKPLGGNANLVDYYVKNDQIVLNFDEHYYEMSNTTEVLVREAIVRTLSQIPGIDSISFEVKNQPLLDSYGKPMGVMKGDTFIDNTGKEINSYEKTSLILYYANYSGNGLVSVVKNPVYSTNISLEKLVIEELIKGPPTGADAYQAVPVDTKIINTTTKDGICYVNLSNEFLNTVNNVTEEVVIYSIVNSLSELSNVNKVQISINGDYGRIYKDQISLSNILERNLDLVGEGGVR